MSLILPFFFWNSSLSDKLGKIEKTLDFKLSFQFSPPLSIGLIVVVRVGRDIGGQFLSLMGAFISNLSLLRSLDPY